MVKMRRSELGPPIQSTPSSNMVLSPVPFEPSPKQRDSLYLKTWEKPAKIVSSLGRKRLLAGSLPPRNRTGTGNFPLLGKMKTVRSGKIYRQIFNDEVQLVRSLAESRKKSVDHVASLKSGKIPLIKNFEIPTGQLLAPRQRMWAHALPNDKSTENPVLYRETRIAAMEKNKETESMIAAQEVRGLSDFIVPEKIDSDIIQRLDERKRCIHESHLKKLQKELSQIGMEMESLIAEPGKELLTKLSESDEKIDALFKAIEGDEELGTFRIQNLWELWDILSNKFVMRRKWIKDFDATLKKLEALRAEKLGNILKKYMGILQDNAYLLSQEVEKLIHKEAMIINQALLGNQRAVAKLFINLMESNLKQEINNHNRWQDLIKLWKTMKKDSVIQSFRIFMDSEKIQNPPSVKLEMDSMIKDLERLNEERISLLNSVSDVLPPLYSRDILDRWYSSLHFLNKQLDHCSVDGVMRMRLQYEKNWQECLAFMEQCKKQLLDWNVFSLEEMDHSMGPSFFQMIGTLQRQVEGELEVMDKALEEAAKKSVMQSQDLLKYLKGAVHLWEVHQNNLAQEEKDLEKKMELSRNKHKSEIESKEARLDIVLDQMRQQNNEESLKTHLDKSYYLLRDIKRRYENFHKDLLNEVRGYPFFILKALKEYSLSLSRYFNVREIYEQTMEGQVMLLFRDTAEILEKSPSHLKDIIKKFLKLGEEEKISPSAGSELTLRSKSESRPASLAEENGENERIIYETDRPKKSLLEEVGEQESIGESPEDSLEEPLQESLEALSPYEIQVPWRQEHLLPLFVSLCLAQFLTHRVQPDIISEEESVSESSDGDLETFLTSSGNKYLVLSLSEKAESKLYSSILFEATPDDTPQNTVSYLEHMILPSQLFSKLQKRIRYEFFEYLERWFGQCLSNAKVVVDSKIEELNSELELRHHLHRPRLKRIKRDIHNVRAAEILYHQQRLDRHCSSIMEVLRKERLLFCKFNEEQNIKNKNFRIRMNGIELAFLNTTTTRKLALFSSNLHRELMSYMDVMQVSLRSFRQYLEENLGKLRLANIDFVKNCRLFSEGGNFSPDEVTAFCGRLEKESSRIEFVENYIMIKMEQMENEYIEQASEIINKFEMKFHNLSVDLIFIEKIQRFLTNLQVNIKAEVYKSNFQTESLNDALEQLHNKISICGQESANQTTVTAEEVYDFSKQLMEKLTQRIHYLNCFVDIQGSGASTEKESVLFVSMDFSEEESKIAVVKETLLQPSRMGKSMLDDVVVEVIKNILHPPEQKRERDTTGKFKVRRPRRRTESISTTLKVTSLGSSFSQASIQRYSRPNRQDKKYQVFGEKPDHSEHFKGIMHLLLWEGNDTLLSVAEDFYRKEKHLVTRPEYMQDTFEQCADVLGRKLLEYEIQIEEYHNSCLTELRDQLKDFEEQLPLIARLFMESFLKRHWENLRSSKAVIQEQFNEQLEHWIKLRDENNQQLHPDLGHPNNSQIMEILCEKEEQRQKDQDAGIFATSEKLDECVKKCARKFINALALLSEKFLLQLDEVHTVEDVQTAKIDPSRVRASVLMRRKIAGLPLDDDREKIQNERVSKKWPGISPTSFTINNKIHFRATPAVITHKCTLGHQAAVEARDAVYLKYLEDLQLELQKIEEEKDIQLCKAERWKGWWNRSVDTIKSLYP